MILSETLQYKRWILQFSDPDKESAKLLVDSIKYVDEDNFIKTLYQTIISTTKETDIYALYAVREKKQISYFSVNGINPLPQRVDSNEGIGSEGEIAHFIRDVSRRQTNFLDHPSLAEMKMKKCRHIIFIDDFSGTGNRINDFIDWFYEDKTIKSWFSLRYIDFIIYIYAITEKALHYLESNKKINKINYEIIIDKGSPLWTPQEYSDIKNLCEQYGKCFKIPQKFLLGYEKSFALIIFSHKCPNNVPGIIWYSKAKKFVPLINYRPNFDFPKIETVLYSFSELIKRLNYVFTKKRQVKRIIGNNEELLLMLQFLNKGRFNAIRINKYLNISTSKINRNLSLLLKNGLIDSSNNITKDGRKIVAYLKKKEKKAQPLEEKNDLYYPMTLRAPV